MSYEQILSEFTTQLDVFTDMQEHLPTLRSYASRCQRIVEFGVDDCTSTWALLAGAPLWMRSYDIVRKPEVDHVEAAVINSATDFKFILGSSLLIEIEPTDLLLIDSYHSYDQLRQELALHAAKVAKCIIMHDTVTWGVVGEDNKTPSLCAAFQEFLVKQPAWRVKEHFTNWHGLTVLERTS